MIGALVRASLASLLIAGTAMAESKITLLDFSDLNGWAEDDHAEALAVFRSSCSTFSAPDWIGICLAATDVADPKAFFEEHFRPVMVEDGRDPLFTGYYEPQIPGSLVRTAHFAYPVYSLPPEVTPGQVWLTRQEIEESGVLEGRGLELAWLADPVERFFLQVQGSGRILLPDGSVLRLGFAARNGRPYASVGEEMVRQGLATRNTISAQAIRDWVRAHPEEGRELLWANPSYIFFRRLPDTDPHLGPPGAMARPVTAMRTIAVDPDFTPLGAPVWLEKGGPIPLTRLMIAQDTGSAIRGAQRADIFYGSGDEAGRLAGRVRDGGRMIVLVPRQRAESLPPVN